MSLNHRQKQKSSITTLTESPRSKNSSNISQNSQSRQSSHSRSPSQHSGRPPLPNYSNSEVIEERTQASESLPLYQKLKKSLCSNHSGRNQFSPRPQSNINSFESAELDRFGKSLEKITTELDEIAQEKEKSFKTITRIKKIIAKNPLEENTSDHKLLIQLAELKLTVKTLKTRLDTAESNIHQTEPDHINIIETYTSDTLLESSEKQEFCSCIIS